MATAQMSDQTQMCYQMLGCVVEVTEKSNYDDPTYFTILNTNGIRYKCVCKFYKPVQPGDIIAGYVTIEAGNLYNFASEPFVEIPVDEFNIKECFIRALRGSGFGKVTADTLYDKIKSMIKINILVKSVPSLDSLTIGAIPGLPMAGVYEKEEEKEITPQSVLTYLGEESLEYKKTQNPAIISRFISGTELKEKQVKALLVWWYQNRSLRRLHLLGLTNKEINECERPLDEIYEICTGENANPFKLPPIPLEKCASILALKGIIPTPKQITCGKIVRKIYDMLKNAAWTCTPDWLLKKAFAEFNSLRSTLSSEYDIIFENNCAYLQYPHTVESFVANYINDLVLSTSEKIMALPSADTPMIETAIFKCQTLDNEQKLAIQGCLHHDISMISGGPGTGKTTIIGEIVRNLTLREVPFIACAFTGCAVSRIQDVLGTRSAITIDKLISRAARIPPFKVLIADEKSMISTELMYRLFKAFPFKFRLILVGDINQLPPVSWGMFAHGLIRSGRVPIYRLFRNHRIVKHITTLEEKREAEKVDTSGLAPGVIEFDRSILDNIEALVNPSRTLTEPLQFKEDFAFTILEGDVDMITTLIRGLHQSGVKKEQITILSPYVEYLPHLNLIFQTIYLPLAKMTTDPEGGVWKVGTRVMMIVNNYDINVMNGENGEVVEVHKEGIDVRFKDQVVHTFLFPEKGKNVYARKKTYRDITESGEALGEEEDPEIKALCTTDLAQSFSCTVHKAQGSEQHYIILYIPLRMTRNGTPSSFVNIPLLFTGISRTKRCIWIVGSKTAIDAATVQPLKKRYDNLSWRLMMLSNPEKDGKLVEMITAQTQRFKDAMLAQADATGISEKTDDDYALAAVEAADEFEYE